MLFVVLISSPKVIQKPTKDRPPPFSFPFLKPQMISRAVARPVHLVAGFLNVSQRRERDAIKLQKGEKRVNASAGTKKVQDLGRRSLWLLFGITASPCTAEAADPWTASWLYYLQEGAKGNTKTI